MALVTVTYLQQTDPSQLVPSSRPLPEDARIDWVQQITPEFSRFLYLGVGSELHWADRLVLTRRQWLEQLRAPGSETHVLYRHGAPQGYIELAAVPGTAGTEVEIFYFGLFPQAIGQGLGGALLTEGIRRAWTLDERHAGMAPVSRVWLHTCSLDGQQALPNYQARGFTVYDVQEEQTEVRDPSKDLWPDASRV
ncbi:MULTISPECIES: GNAT family N-acetyltransferase [Glutamicibacter]|uniref:GNAT family N-acetyltransferase n=1 Tax=Glutamicibacter creatinolyticus TaxID=162496 RepID=A0A5B7WVL3_9MICC|nr:MULTISPECIES: GNAT family N-acetyltransferase [Glutamicibacter]QCY47932.1 GNAT family N-acetyltransferase [Glutamicibacter creatinolyticus]TLK50918.1 GNAT family N-acetyltransferase [Glutamicibacter sp. V16R2B1]